MVASPQMIDQPGAVSPAPQLNWRTCWYPIVFAVDLPTDQPYGFSIFAEPFVLFRDHQGQLVCVIDRCPHRLAKLSDGRVTDGRLECLYHGWQFGQGGACVHIPHLLAGATIPERSHTQSFPVQLHQGLIWVWADGDVPPNPATPPTIPGLEKDGVFQVHTATDLPFDHTFLVENLLDPAHVYISHDGTELNISRDDAAPLEMEVLATSVEGIQGRFRRAEQPQAPWVNVTFYAPGLVHYDFSNPAYGVVGGLGLYALPVAPGHSRIFVRRYGTFFKRSFTLKPRWLEHLRQNKILEEDLAFIVAQEQFFQQSQRPIRSAYFPLKTCDTLVMEHRRWLDLFGANLPWYLGLATVKAPAMGAEPVGLSTRFERHTQSCSACRGAYEQLGLIRQAAWVGAVTSVALALVSDGQLKMVFVASFLLAMGAIALAQSLESRFL